jgi:hypothetical protein
MTCSVGNGNMEIETAVEKVVGRLLSRHVGSKTDPVDIIQLGWITTSPVNEGRRPRWPSLEFCAVVCFVDKCLCLFYWELVVEENSELCQSGFPIANGLQ